MVRVLVVEDPVEPPIEEEKSLEPLIDPDLDEDESIDPLMVRVVEDPEEPLADPYLEEMKSLELGMVRVVVVVDPVEPPVSPEDEASDPD